jgi:hypothetical protein
MKIMTKRDVADIALVLVILNFIVRLTTFLIDFIFTISIITDNSLITNWRTSNILRNISSIIVITFVTWILISKRNKILDYFFSNATDTEIVLHEETRILTNYAFWIRLLGIILLITSIIEDLPKLVITILNYFPQLNIPRNYFPTTTVFNYGMFSIFISLFVIWKADWIADVLGKFGKKQITKESEGLDKT